MAVPGAKMLVTKGLLHKVKTENELAMVLGHELGHFKHKDNIKAMGKGLIFAVAGVLISSDNYGSLFGTTLELANNRYSQEQEMDADLFGVEMMQCAYGTANGATALFEKMKKEGEGWKYLLADHPDFIKRIEKMKAYIREKGYDNSKKMIPLGRIYK
jgi:Zn-dependent protease with chaperone function